MDTDQMTTLDALIKTRVHPEMKQSLEEIADARQLSLADVIREAVREYIGKRRVPRKAQVKK